MAQFTNPCPICGEASSVTLHSQIDTHKGDCPICGRVRISQEAVDALSSKQRYLVSAFFRMHNSRAKPPELRLDNLETSLRDLPVMRPQEKLDLLLARVAAKQPYLDVMSSFNPKTDYPLIFASSSGEAYYLLGELQYRGFVSTDTGGHHFRMTIQGWQRLDEIQQSGRTSNVVFVAMSFDPGRQFVYDEAIKPAVLGAGYEPRRLDNYEHANRIDDEIIGQIKGARFMVADFTQQRAGIYFEAGLMLGLGRNVIWMCERSELTQTDRNKPHIHFDIRQFNFIDYVSTAEAMQRLLNRILALEGQGSTRTNSLPATPSI